MTFLTNANTGQVTGQDVKMFDLRLLLTNDFYT